MRRALLVAAPVLAHAVFGASILAQGKGNVAAFTKIPIDLNAATVNDPLPFEVPFILSGIAAPRTVGIRIQVAKSTKFAPKAEGAGSMTKCADTIATDGVLWANAPKYEWRARSGASATDTPFGISILKPLDAGHYYRFRFTILKQLDGDAATKFTKDAAERLSVALATASISNSSDEAAKALRQSLQSELKKTLGCGRMFAAGSLFSDDRDWVPLRNEFLETVIKDALTPQARRDLALNNYSKDAA